MTTIDRTVAGDAGGIAMVMQLVDDLAAECDLPASAVTDMQVALDEVLANIVSYAHPDGSAHDIRVRLTVTGSVLEAEVEDDGQPFDPLTAPAPDLSAPLADRQVGGLGIHFVKRLMSEVRYARVGDRNRLVLRRRLDDAREADARGAS
ncbi:MAG: ATP-binding protein [Candidatus Rokuibacteriota bacterium]